MLSACVFSIKLKKREVYNFVYFGFLRNCINCVHNCEDHSSFDVPPYNQVLRWPTTVTSNINWSHQIQIAHFENKLLTSKNKILTSHTKSRHQIQNPDIKLQNPDIVTKIKRFNVGERKLVSTWCNHHIVVSRYFICNTTVRTTIPHRPTYSYIAVHSSLTWPYIALHSRTQVFEHRLCKEVTL